MHPNSHIDHDQDLPQPLRCLLHCTLDFIADTRHALGQAGQHPLYSTR